MKFLRTDTLISCYSQWLGFTCWSSKDWEHFCLHSSLSHPALPQRPPFHRAAPTCVSSLRVLRMMLGWRKLIWSGVIESRLAVLSLRKPISHPGGDQVQWDTLGWDESEFKPLVVLSSNSRLFWTTLYSALAMDYPILAYSNPSSQWLGEIGKGPTFNKAQ